MSAGTWLRNAAHQLKEAGVRSYNLDCLLLFEHVLKINRASILAHQDEELADDNLKKLNNLLERRVRREPLAYITGKKEFCGRYFTVNDSVLIPRPESESFIELLKKYHLTKGSLIDVGCGSGILGVTAKLESPKLQVTLSDIDNKALEVAKNNAKRLDAKVTFLEEALFNSYYDIVLANLPYVPPTMKLEPELAYEPKVALFAEAGGLQIYRDFCKKVAIFKPKYILTESLKIQHQELNQMMVNDGYELVETDVLVQLFKLVR